MATSPTSRRRCDSAGRAFAGSQRQIQYYVNEQPDLLQEAISEAMQTTLALEWVSPLRCDKYREYRDGAFLKALGLSKHRKALSYFWPKGGPVWDALALDRVTGGVVLLESKSHVPEIFGNGCGAVSPCSIQKIDDSIAATKLWLSVPERSEWKAALYQAANRIAHLYWFREVLRVPAWLVNIYFTEDPHSPTTVSEWNEAVADMKYSLGISQIPFYADVLLPARS